MHRTEHSKNNIIQIDSTQYSKESHLLSLSCELQDLRLECEKLRNRVVVLENDQYQAQEVKAEIKSLTSQIKSLEIERDGLKALLVSIAFSTSWRLTAPLRWVSALQRKSMSIIPGLKKKHKPSNPIERAVGKFKSVKSLEQECEKLKKRIAMLEGNHDIVHESLSSTDDRKKAAESIAVEKWLEARWQWPSPIRSFITASSEKRLSVVVDSTGPNSLFGGVGTAFILSTLLANRLRIPLRLITRSDPPDPGAFSSVIAANGLKIETPFDAVFIPRSNRRELPISENDYFISTSWWATKSLQASIKSERIFWLLQEDERMFYPYGDELLRCEEALNDPNIFLIINSRLLFDYLAAGPNAIVDLEERGIWFEPAFPGIRLFKDRPSESISKSSSKRKLFFYARPNHLRNLFARGIEALASAINDGTFYASEWEIYMVGKDVPKFAFPNGIRIHYLEGLGWAEYQELVMSMDAGFVLMGTPHPSYPPLDLAAAGAAVLTNSFGNKTDLSNYSANIITADLSLAALKNGLKQLSKAAIDDSKRIKNLHSDNICRNWEVSFSGVLDHLENVITEKSQSFEKMVLSNSVQK